MFVAAPGVAGAADPCQLGWSNVGPRSCAMTDVGMAPVLTLGNGICAGVMIASGTAFDGPLYHYSTFPGATHAVDLRISQASHRWVSGRRPSWPATSPQSSIGRTSTPAGAAR